MTRKTVLNTPKTDVKPNQFDPKWRQNVTQDGSFHGTKDGAHPIKSKLYFGRFWDGLGNTARRYLLECC